MRKLYGFLLSGLLLATLAMTNAIGQEWRGKPSAQINYTTWDGSHWSAKLSGNGFFIARDGNWGAGQPSDHIQYVTWDGSSWSARPAGPNFYIAPNGNWAAGKQSAEINYIMWDGTHWIARIQPDGNFLIRRHHEH